MMTHGGRRLNPLFSTAAWAKMRQFYRKPLNSLALATASGILFPKRIQTQRGDRP
jgi:hypothetical protein